MLASVLIKDPDISSMGTHVPDHVRSVVRHCLVKDPKRRLCDIGDVRLAMEGTFETTVRAPSELAVASTLPAWLRQRPVTLAIALLASLAAGGLAVWSLTRPAPQPGQITRFPIPLPADQALSFLGRPLVAISPDGSQIVYVANRSLWLRPVDQLQAVQVPGTEEGRGPFFSPDGRSIGFYAPEALRKVSVSGGAAVTIADGLNKPSGASWGGDDIILFGQPEGIMQVPGAGGTPEVLIPANDGEILHGPQMLPGDEWVLFTVLAGQASWDEAQIVAQSVTTSERMVLVDGGRDGRYLPTGHLVYGLNNVLLAVPFDVGSRRVTGGPVPLVEGVGAAAGNPQAGAMQFSASTDGSLVYVPDSAAGRRGFSLVWVDRDGREESFGTPPGDYVYPRISPDGGRVALDSQSGDGDAIWIWDFAQETLTRLIGDGSLRYPVWTSDGERLAYGSGQSFYWKASNNTGAAELLAESPGSGNAANPNPYFSHLMGRHSSFATRTLQKPPMTST